LNQNEWSEDTWYSPNCEDVDQSDCFCGECPSFDELNGTCWAFPGRFGEKVSSEAIVCEWGYKRYFNPETKVIW